MPRKKKVDFDFVRSIALSFPDVEESTTYGSPAFKLRKKLLACIAIHKSAEPDSLVARVGFDRRAELIETAPDVYYLTDHYVNYPAVLVRLARLHPDAVRDLLGMAWRFATTESPGGKRASPRRRVQASRAKSGAA